MSERWRWLVGEVSFGLLTIVYRAWGRCWIDDDTCRVTATWIMAGAIWLARPHPTEAPDAR